MKYHDHAEILPLLEGAGQSWAHVNDDTRRERRTTLAFGFAEINGAAALLNEAARDIDEDGSRLTALAELLARSEKEGGHAIQ